MTTIEVLKFPKWVPPHPSLIVRKPGFGDAPEHVSVPGFEAVHVMRGTGEVFVLVGNRDEEKRATSPVVSKKLSDDSELPISEGVRRIAAAAEMERWPEMDK